jgi:hypothetical protein
MRFLADENFPGDGVNALRLEGHDVLWISETASGATDARVLEMAQAEARILLTFDKDFGELAWRRLACVMRDHSVSLGDALCGIGRHGVGGAHCRALGLGQPFFGD